MRKEQDQKFNMLSNIEKLEVYHFISGYYIEGVTAISHESLKRLGFLEDCDNDVLAQVFREISEGITDIEQATFDYNRLFIGPDKVHAAPYESVYRNPQKLMMQKETIEVREFYRKLGLESNTKDKVPDDHLGFELEFICYILYQILQDDEQKDNLANIYTSFLSKHVLMWVFKHCQDVLDNSSTKLCSGMATLLQEMFELERYEIDSMEAN